MVKQNVLVVGSGGREHALAWKLSQSSKLGKLFVAPGNPGTAKIAENVNIKATDISKLKRFARKNEVGLTIVGPDIPLELGIVDKFQKNNLRIFGPTKKAAEIEWSKSFSKKFMQKHSVPSANFKIFNNQDSALDYIRIKPLPIVVKVSGLALGKGVFVCKTLREARAALQQIFVSKVFGRSGNKVVVEDYLEGMELSIHALSTGKKALVFPPAQDHKTIFEDEKGPNTGGMGSYTPIPWVNENLMRELTQSIIQPTLVGMVHEERNFSGCLFPGLIITKDGVKVLEFNARFGDPETQSYMRLLKTDLLDLLNACVDGILTGTKLVWEKGYAVCVVLASKGYPGKIEVGYEIKGVKEAESIPGVVVFHAGTEFINDKLVTSGGRVLSVTAVGNSIEEVRDKVYQAISHISFEGMAFRTDIAAKALGHQVQAS